MSLTMDAVLALAPDGASVQAARGLAVPGPWQLLGADERAAWGECRGSGSKPYQTQVDLAGPAFRCSCPSRKFPCKHGLALLMLRAQGTAFTATEPPAWVTEWLAGRAEKAQKKEEKAAAPPAPADPQAALQREAQRWRRIEAGAAELQRWLADQVAYGLGGMDTERLQGWHTMAARLVDAQAPGLAARVREAAAALPQPDAGPVRCLQHLGRLQLACSALQRRATLPPAVQAELRSVVGWPHDRAEVLAHAPPQADRWTVLACVVEARDDKLTERRVWLHGQRSGQRALLLDHAFGGRGFDQAWLAGTAVDATLAWYPGSGMHRALCVQAEGALGDPLWPAATAAQEWQQTAQRVAASPWLAVLPLVLPQAVVQRAGAHTWAVAEGRALPLRLPDGEAWTLLAGSGGHPLALMGEWDGQLLLPLTAWQPGDRQPRWLKAAA